MSTPPLSRNTTSSHLDSNNQQVEKKLSQQIEHQQMVSSTYSQSNQPKSAHEKTREVLQEAPEVQKRPKLRSKRSQPNLLVNMNSSPSCSSHTPPVARDVNSTTTNLITSISTTLTSISQSDNPITPKSSNSHPSVTASLASTKTIEKGAVPASDLAKGLTAIIDIGLHQNILKPEKLALLLVTLDNQRGKGAESVKTALRESLFIIDYQSASGAQYKKLNIMERFCEPFISHHLDQKKLDELLQKVMREYDKVGVKVTKLSEGLREVEQINHPEIVALMAPAMKLVGEYFFGSDSKLKSSKFPDPIKKLLLEIDRQVIAQFEKTGSGEMRELLQRRKSTLVGFISTFSFMPIWAPKLAADSKKSSGFYAKLSSYINSYLVNKVDSFVIDILINQEHQSERVKRHVGDYVKELKLLTQSASKLQSVGGDKSSMLSSIKGLLSTRSSSTSHSNVAPKESLEEESGFNEEEARKREMQRNRIKKLTKFAETAGFDKISTDFFALIRNKIIDLKSNDYILFAKDPVAYCQQQLKIFILQMDEVTTDPDLYSKIEMTINSYSKNSERKKEEKKLRLNSSSMTLDISPLKKSGKAKQIDEKSETTESSTSVVEQKVSVVAQVESKPVSEKTESDSSTSVETEKSDD